MEKDQFNRAWILEHGIPEAEKYGGEITLRALHYRLVAAGMTNTMRHYKRVISAMSYARWEGLINFDAFVDHDREVIGETDAAHTDVDESIEEGKGSVQFWLEHYRKNKWENQPIYPEVWIEKKALQSVFTRPCRAYDVALCPCKGYPSLTFQHEAADRFKTALLTRNQTPVILYFGDYDPSGEDIPRSLKDTLYRMGVDVDVRRIALMEKQVIEFNLPPAPTKEGDSRTANWDGLGQVELDAIEPNKLKSMAKDAISSILDTELLAELAVQEDKEREIYRDSLKEYASNL